jgi:hypothetical protein
MPDGVNLAYATEGLHSGASGLATASGVSDAATARLQGAPLAAGMFGRTSGAGGFAGAVGAARAAQARGFRRESERSRDLGRGSSAAGDLGDGLTAGTTSIAAAARRGGAS